MASYRIELKKSAAKEIEKLKNRTTRRLLTESRSLLRNRVGQVVRNYQAASVIE